MIEADRTNPTALGLDELPTQPSAFKAHVVCIAAGMLALLGGGFWYYGAQAYKKLKENNVPAVIHLEGTDLYRVLPHIFDGIGGAAALCGIAALLGFVRISATYHILRGALFTVYPVLLAYMVLVWLVIFELVGGQVPFDGGEMDRAQGVRTWWGLSWPALLTGLYTVWLHVMLWSRPVYAAYTRDEGGAMPGDRVLEDWRTGGKDPRARKGFYASFATHIIVLIIIPFLLGLRGCVEGYKVPAGSGNPEVVVQAVVQPQKRKKQTITVRPNSPILFDMEDLPDETEVDQQMDNDTQARYEVNPDARAGATGAGGGDQGGWPEGSEDYRIRFIRLAHGGRGWDDGMGQTMADVNFLNHFADRTGLRRVANAGESHPIASLADYPDDAFPPFVYMTGNGGIGRVSSNDIEVLRDYLVGGGMLIADAGHRDFGRSFEDLMRRVFPNNSLVTIATDEMLFQLPFRFDNGAPPLWSHYGSQARGIRYEGRWVVFFHPGDMNDAWKSRAYNGDIEPEVRQAALDLGVNLVYYAFTQWNNIISQQNR